MGQHRARPPPSSTFCYLGGPGSWMAYLANGHPSQRGKVKAKQLEKVTTSPPTWYLGDETQAP